MSQGRPPEPRQGLAASLAAFAGRRSLVMLALGVAAGLPNLLIFDTLSAWLRDAGMSLKVISFFSLATLSYSLKFVWAPLVDRTRVPVLTGLLGHRRSWMLVMQALIMTGLWLIATTDPVHALRTMALVAVLTGLASATQDIVIDAWRIEVSDDTQQGTMAAAYQWGYRIAMIVAGVVPLLLAKRYGWSTSYGVMASVMALGMIAVLLAPREKQHSLRPIPVEGLPSRPVLEGVEWLVRLAMLAAACLILGCGLTGTPDALVSLLGALGLGAEITGKVASAFTAKTSGAVVQLLAVIAGLCLLVAACWPVPRHPTRPGAYLAGSFGAPLKDFFTRFGGTAWPILALICAYRVSDFVLNIMTPFYLDLGFGLENIAEARKVFGVAMLALGVFLGGLGVSRLGLKRALVVGAFAGPLSNLVFAWLATRGPSLNALHVAIGVDNLASGFAGTTLIAYMSSLTSAGFTATQYALFSSLYALPGKLIASQSGRVVEGAARAADVGGVMARLKDLFVSTPPSAFAAAAERAGVTPAALGAGYVLFFLYSTAIGVVAILLTLVVVGRGPSNGSSETPPQG